MVAEALSWYLESLATFWTGMARVDLVRMLLLAAILWWVFGDRCRAHRCCPRCGCRCGRCRCREVDGRGEAEAEPGSGDTDGPAPA